MSVAPEITRAIYRQIDADWMLHKAGELEPLWSLEQTPPPFWDNLPGFSGIRPRDMAKHRHQFAITSNEKVTASLPSLFIDRQCSYEATVRSALVAQPQVPPNVVYRG